MLPYTPLHDLLSSRRPGFPAPLVMTSGNLAEEPIAYTNDEARARSPPWPTPSSCTTETSTSAAMSVVGQG
jgi:hypothetical protein